MPVYTPEEWDKISRGSYEVDVGGHVFNGNENEGLLGDVGTGLKTGLVQVGRQIAGGLDYLTAGEASTALNPWFAHKEQEYRNEYSPETQIALKGYEQNVADAQERDGELGGFAASLGGVLSNPRVALVKTAEAAPSTALGVIPGVMAARAARAGAAAAGVARSAMAKGTVQDAVASAPKSILHDKATINAALRGSALGEGALGMGGSMNQIVAENNEAGRDPMRGAWAPPLIGAATAGTALAFGKFLPGAGKEAALATVLSGGKLGGALAANTAKPQSLLGKAWGATKSLGKSGLEEGAEEGTQGVFETGFQNAALDKPITEGMGQNIGESAAIGAAMGMGMHSVTRPFSGGSNPPSGGMQYSTGQTTEDLRDPLTKESRAVLDSAAEQQPMQGTFTGQPPQGGMPITQPQGAPEQAIPQTPQASQETGSVDDATLADIVREADETQTQAQPQQQPAPNQQPVSDVDQDIQAASQKVQDQVTAAEQARAQVNDRKQARADKKAQAAADERAVKDASLAFPRSTEPHPAGKRDSTRAMKPLGAQDYIKATFPEKAKVADVLDRANAITRDTKTSRSAFSDVGVLASATAKMTEGAKSLDDVKANLEKRATAWLKSGDTTQGKQAVTYRTAYEMLDDPSLTDADAKAKAEKWIEANKPKAPESTDAPTTPKEGKPKSTDLQDKYFFSYTPSKGVRAEWTKHSKEIGEEDADKLIRAVQTAFSSGKGDSGTRRSKDAKKVIEAATAIVKQFKEHKKIAQGNMADPANGTADKLYHFFNHVSNRDREMLEKVGVTPEELSQIGKVFQTGKVAEDEYEMAPLFEPGKPNPTVEQVAEVMRNRLRVSGSIYGPDDRIYSRLDAEQRRIHDAAEEQVLSEMDSTDSSIMSDEAANEEKNARVVARGINKSEDSDEDAGSAEDGFMRLSNETQETRLERALSDHIKRIIGRAMADIDVMKKSRSGKLEPMQSLRVPVRNPHGVLLYERDKLTGKEVPQTTDIFIPPENAASLVKEQGKTAELQQRLAKEMPDLLARACTVINYAARNLSKGGQIDRLQEVILNTYAAVGEVTKVSGLAPDKSKVLHFLLDLENTLMDKSLKAADKRKAILEQTRPFADLVITKEKDSTGKEKSGQAAQARREKERERFHQIAVNQARVFLAKGKETLVDEAAANTHLTERQINELFGSNETRDEFISDESVKDSATDKAEAAKLDAATEQANRKMTLAKFFGNNSYRNFTDSEANAMSKYHKAYVKGEAGESGKRRVVRGEAALKFADAAARIVMRGSFFPRILKVGEKKKWYQRIQAAVGDFQKTFQGDILGYRERIPSPMDNAGNMNGFVQKVIGNDKLIYDNPYKNIKRVELRPYIAKLEATRQAIRVEFGAVIARDVPKFLTAYSIGLKKFTGPIADLQKGSRLTALDDYDNLVRSFVDAARCSPATKQKVIAYMNEAKDLAEKEIRRQEQFYNDPTSRANLPVAPLETGTNEVAPKAVATEGQKKNPTNPSKEGEAETLHMRPLESFRGDPKLDVNQPHEQLTTEKLKQISSSNASPEVRRAAAYIDSLTIDGATAHGVGVPLDVAADSLRKNGYSPDCLDGVFTSDTAAILAEAVKQFDALGIPLPKGLVAIDGIKSFGQTRVTTLFSGSKGALSGMAPTGSRITVPCKGGTIFLKTGYCEVFPENLKLRMRKEWLERRGKRESVYAIAEEHALTTATHELIHAKDKENNYAKAIEAGMLITRANSAQGAEFFNLVLNDSTPYAIYEACQYASGQALADYESMIRQTANASAAELVKWRTLGTELFASLLPVCMRHPSAMEYLETHAPEITKLLKGALHVYGFRLDRLPTATDSGSVTNGQARVGSGLAQSKQAERTDRADSVAEKPVDAANAHRGGNPRPKSEEVVPSGALLVGEVERNVGSHKAQVPVSGHGAGRGTTQLRRNTENSDRGTPAERKNSDSGTQSREKSNSGDVRRARGNEVLPSQGDRGSSGDGTPVSGPEATARDQILERVPEKLKPLARTVLNKSKNGGLRFMFTRNFVDTFAKTLPSLRDWWHNVERLMQMRAKRQQDAADIAERFQKLSKYEQGRVNQVLDDATTLGVWPYRDTRVFPTEDSWNKYVNKMVKKGPEYGLFMRRFSSLTTAAKQSVKDVLDYGTEEKLKLAELAKRNIERSMQKQIDGAKGEAQDALKAELERQKADVDKDLQEALTHPYVPYGRQGNHIVVYRSENYLRAERALNTYKERLANQGTPPTETQKKVLSVLQDALDKAETSPNDYVVEFYESELEANKRYYALQKQFPNAPKEAVQTFDKAEYTSQNAPKWAQYQNILNELDKEMEGENGTGSIREGDLRRMAAEVQELFAKSLPSSSGRKSLLRRKGIAGYNPNMMENFVHHARATSHMIASMETSWDINESLANISKEAEERGKFGDRDQATLVANEVRRRQRQIFNPMRGEVSGKVMRVTSMWMLLTNPAFYLQNLLQPFMMSAPYINGRFKGNCLPELMRTMKDVATFVKQDRTLRNLRETLTDSEYKALMDARDRQLLTIGITTELGEVGDDTALGRATNFFLRQAQMVETINRVSTFLVAYREGIRRGLKKEEAAAFAEKTIEQTHGDYSKENAPSLFNENGVMRMATQFRKFQFIQTGMMFRMMRDAAKGLSPEERAIARRQLAWTLMTHLAMAGVKGLPAANLILGAVAFCFGAPGDDDEDLIRRAIKDKDTSDLLLKGLPTLMGLDLSRKVGAGEMLSPLPFWNYDPSQGKRNATELIANAAGPWASLASRTWDAQKFFLQGDYMKALEQVLPYGVFSNGIKAMRLGTQGYTNNTGDVLINPKDFSAWDLFGTSMGLTTSTMGDRSRLQGSVLNHDNAFNARKSRLQRDFNYAKKIHDYKGMAAAIKALGDLNIEMRKVGYKPFKPDTLQSGAKQQGKREQNARGGVATTERNRRYTQTNSQW